MIAKGKFKIELSAIETHADYHESNFMKRWSMDKTYSGDLVGKSDGEMLNLRSSAEPSSAGYVAIECIDAILDGKKGRFSLQHFGTMDKGEAYLKVEIIPDTGTGDLAGVRGSLDIDIVDGEHFYTLDYQL